MSENEASISVMSSRREKEPPTTSWLGSLAGEGREEHAGKSLANAEIV